MPICITITSPPRTKKNSGTIIPPSGQRKHSIIVPSPAFTKWNRQAQKQLALYRRKHGPLPCKVDVNCRALIYREARTGDAVGYYQAIADALQEGQILVNDRQIVSWDGTRMLKDAINPRVEITLTASGPAQDVLFKPGEDGVNLDGEVA